MPADRPETCPTCKSKPGYRSGPFCLGSHPDKWHETHRDPTPTGRIYPDCTCAWKVPDVRCPWHGNATPTPPGAAPDAASGPNAPPRMPAPADAARPMVVGGAFVKFDRPTPADDARIYPCADCGLMRSRSEGGTTFTVCDVCWDKAYPTAPAPDAGARIEEAHRALGKPGRMDDDGCCVGCGRSVQPSPCCPDFPVWPGPCRSCYAYDEEQRDAGAAEDHPSEASRDHGAEGSDRAVVEALTALRDRFAALITRNPDFGATDWALVEQADAALRGTKGGPA